MPPRCQFCLNYHGGPCWITVSFTHYWALAEEQERESLERMWRLPAYEAA